MKKKHKTIKIGIIGPTGTGKTVYQLALSYRYYKREENSDIVIIPADPLTKKFVDREIINLKEGKMVASTQKTQDYKYEVDYNKHYKSKDKLYLILKDYRGGIINDLFTNTIEEIKNIKKEELKEIRDYFKDCNGFLVLFDDKDLLKEDIKIIQLYKSIIYSILALPEKKKIEIPIAFLITKIDEIKGDKEKEKKIEKNIQNFKMDIKDKIKYFKVFKVSSLGNDYEEGKTNWKWEPVNVMEPIKWFVDSYLNELKILRKKKIKYASLIFCFIVVFLFIYSISYILDIRKNIIKDNKIDYKIVKRVESIYQSLYFNPAIFVIDNIFKTSINIINKIPFIDKFSYYSLEDYLKIAFDKKLEKDLKRLENPIEIQELNYLHKEKDKLFYIGKIILNNSKDKDLKNYILKALNKYNKKFDEKIKIVLVNELEEYRKKIKAFYNNYNELKKIMNKILILEPISYLDKAKYIEVKRICQESLEETQRFNKIYDTILKINKNIKELPEETFEDIKEYITKINEIIKKSLLNIGYEIKLIKNDKRRQILQKEYENLKNRCFEEKNRIIKKLINIFKDKIQNKMKDIISLEELKEIKGKIDIEIEETLKYIDDKTVKEKILELKEMYKKECGKRIEEIKKSIKEFINKYTAQIEEYYENNNEELLRNILDSIETRDILKENSKMCLSLKEKCTQYLDEVIRYKKLNKKIIEINNKIKELPEDTLEDIKIYLTNIDKIIKQNIPEIEDEIRLIKGDKKRQLLQNECDNLKNKCIEEKNRIIKKLTNIYINKIKKEIMNTFNLEKLEDIKEKIDIEIEDILKYIDNEIIKKSILEFRKEYKNICKKRIEEIKVQINNMINKYLILVKIYYKNNNEELLRNILNNIETKNILKENPKICLSLKEKCTQCLDEVIKFNELKEKLIEIDETLKSLQEETLDDIKYSITKIKSILQKNIYNLNNEINGISREKSLLLQKKLRSLTEEYIKEKNRLTQKLVNTYRDTIVENFKEAIISVKLKNLENLKNRIKLEKDSILKYIEDENLKNKLADIINKTLLELERITTPHTYKITFVSAKIDYRYNYEEPDYYLILFYNNRKIKMASKYINSDTSRPSWDWEVVIEDWKAFDPIYIGLYESDPLEDDFICLFSLLHFDLLLLNNKSEAFYNEKKDVSMKIKFKVELIR